MVVFVYWWRMECGVYAEEAITYVNMDTFSSPTLSIPYITIVATTHNGY